MRVKSGLRLASLVAVLLCLGALLAGCGHHQAVPISGVSLVPGPGGGPRISTGGPTWPRGVEVPITVMTGALPKKLPDPLPRACAAGDRVEVAFFDARPKVVYQSCALPPAIQRLRLALIRVDRTLARPIAGAPAGTPAWLMRQARVTAADFEQFQPWRFKIRLGVRAATGAAVIPNTIVDSVDIYGWFTTHDCPGLGNESSTCHATHISFWADPATHANKLFGFG